MFDIFISYKSQERKEARHVKNFLEVNGLSCWMDQDNLKVGEDYEEEIAKVIPKCKGFILLISYASQMSKEVEIEYRLARKYNLEIYPILIENCGISEFYDKELAHCFIKLRYWENENEKKIALCEIRNKLYEIKGIEIQTEEELLKKHIVTYQEQIQETYEYLSANWKRIIEEAVSRCGFLTSQPHHIAAKILGELDQYYDLVDMYIYDIVQFEDEKNIYDFLDFIIKRDILTEAWLTYDEFEPIALGILSYIKKGEYKEGDAFLLRVYKDYILALENKSVAHPIVRLCQRLYEQNQILYTGLMHRIQSENPSTFIDRMSLGVFVHSIYIGMECTNIGGRVNVEEKQTIFLPEMITHPEWIDFVRRFICDILVKELQSDDYGMTFSNFLAENAPFTMDKKVNYMYLYLIQKWTRLRKPEYVKILLRKLGDYDWNYYVNDVKGEIRRLKLFYQLCMWENGYDTDYINELWRNA